MKKEGLSHSYRSVALAAIKHYYTMKDLLLNWKKISKFLGEKSGNNKTPGYTREQISKMLEFADVKYRAVILTLASTGMRREALTDLRVGSMEYLDKYQLYKITIYKGTQHSHTSFTTPEAAEAISLYIKSRKLDKKDKFHDVQTKAVSTSLRSLAIDAGIAAHHTVAKSEGKGRFRDNIPAVHGFRKFCITQLARAKVDTEIAKLLTGDSIGVRSRYLNYSEDDLLAEYSKAIPFLTVSQEQKYKVENAQLLARNEGMDKAVGLIDTRLKEKDREIQELRKEIVYMKEIIRPLSDPLKEEGLTEKQAHDELADQMKTTAKGIKEMERRSKQYADKIIKGTAKNILKKKR
jgi:integrase